MTNLGFRLAMAEHGIKSSRPPSATATCSRRSRRAASSLGGEQSGHVIFRDLATTGDGLLTGLQVLDPSPARPVARCPSWPATP